MKSKIFILALLITISFISYMGQAESVEGELLDFSTVRRLEINQSFPNALELQEELAKSGYAWGENDWFGPEDTDPWVVMIGADVDFRTAQAIARICLAHSSNEIRFAVMRDNDVFDYRVRVIIGSLQFTDDELLTETEMERLLSPDLTQEEFQALGQDL